MMENLQRIVVLAVILAVGIGIFISLYANPEAIEEPEEMDLGPALEESSTQTPIDSEVVIDEKVAVDTSSWKMYRNEEVGLSFRYPPDWMTQELSDYNIKSGAILKLVSPDQQAAYDEFIARDIATEGPYNFDVMVSRWDSINSFYATGLGYDDYKPPYDDLNSYISSGGYAAREKIEEIEIENAKAYEVAILGFGTNYAIMLETDKGIIEIGFANIWGDKEHLTDEVNAIVDSIMIE